MKIKIRVSNEFEAGHVRGIKYLEKTYKKVTERLKMKYYDSEN